MVATGHLAPDESIVLIDAALDLGVRRISVTHPEWGVTAMPVETQQALASRGAVFFERCLVSTEAGQPAGVSFETLVDQIRAVGCETTIAATDYGLPQHAAPVDGLRVYIARLLAAGFDEESVRQMVQTNPARLLGLEP